MDSIVRALTGAHLQKVVVQSTYGAQPGEGLGDLGVLYDFEQAVGALRMRTSIIRAAYYMSNWDSALEDARDKGIVHTFFPPDFVLPMVAPADLGLVAARLLTEEIAHTGVRYVEGPAPYARGCRARVCPGTWSLGSSSPDASEWTRAFQALGFSAAAAISYAHDGRDT